MITVSKNIEKTNNRAFKLTNLAWSLLTLAYFAFLFLKISKFDSRPPLPVFVLPIVIDRTMFNKIKTFARQRDLSFD